MGWSDGQKSPFVLKNIRLSSLRSTLSSSRKSEGDKDGRSLSQSLCPLLYNVCSWSSDGGNKKDTKPTDSDPSPPEYYQQVIMVNFESIRVSLCSFESRKRGHKVFLIQ